MNNLTCPANSILTEFCLYVPAVHEVTISPDGKEVYLVLSGKMREIVASRRMIEQIANASGVTQIKAAMKSYGPPDLEALTRFPGIPVKPPQEIQPFSLLRWNLHQEIIRSFWDGAKMQDRVYPVWSGEMLEFNETNGGMKYYAKNLTNLLHLFMLSQPSSVFKMCENPECKAPYICGGHGNRKSNCGAAACERYYYRNKKRQSRQKLIAT